MPSHSLLYNYSEEIYYYKTCMYSIIYSYYNDHHHGYIYKDCICSEIDYMDASMYNPKNYNRHYEQSAMLVST